MKPISSFFLVFPLMLVTIGLSNKAKGAIVLSQSLLKAAARDDVKEVKSLLLKGADVDAKDNSGDTILHHAARRGRKEVVEVLLANGANVNLKNGDGLTALDVGMVAYWQESSQEIARLLAASGANVSIHVAAFIGDRDKVKRFIEVGASLDKEDDYGFTPLRWAVVGGHRNIAALLLARGADVNACPPWTPLHFAVDEGHPDIVELLISKGASVNVLNGKGFAPLHIAAEAGDEKSVKLLISQGADIDIQDAYGRTPLHCAAVKLRNNIVEFLLSAGAPIDPRDNAGRTPLHYAAGAGFTYGFGGSGDSGVLGFLWDKRRIDSARFVLDRGANINATDKLGWTPLHYAVRTFNKFMVDFLVDRKANSAIADGQGRTPLYLAQGLMPKLLGGHPRENELLGLYGEIADLLRKDSCKYFVANWGEDLYPGTFDRPFRTVGAAIYIAEPGDSIFVRGGTYNCMGTIHIDKSGEPGKPICLRAYESERPVFDLSRAKDGLFLLAGAYWHIKWLIITGGGIRLETQGAHHNILEQITLHDGQGIDMRRGAAYNLFLNCDSFRNFDPWTNGENADGFGGYYGLGRNNVFIGCRAWNNSDDGFDFDRALADVRLENCYASRNGVNIWNHPCFSGSANGFQIKHGEVGQIVLIRGVAWDHPMAGFFWPQSVGVTLHNCTAFQNRFNYAYSGTSGSNVAIVRNSLSFNGPLSLAMDQNMDDQFNSWNTPPGIEITEEDFLSLDDTAFTGPRNPDGSITDSDFLRLAPGSDAVDAGTDVGLPFVGKAPDLGAFERNPAGAGKRGPKMLHQVIRDYDLQRIPKMLAEGTDVNDKDWLGYAPLHWATYFGYPDVAGLLLDNGADSNLKSDTGRTPLEIAEAMDYQEIAGLLRKHGAR